MRVASGAAETDGDASGPVARSSGITLGGGPGRRSRTAVRPEACDDRSEGSDEAGGVAGRAVASSDRPGRTAGLAGITVATSVARAARPGSAGRDPSRPPGRVFAASSRRPPAVSRVASILSAGSTRAAHAPASGAFCSLHDPRASMTDRTWGLAPALAASTAISVERNSSGASRSGLVSAIGLTDARASGSYAPLGCLMDGIISSYLSGTSSAGRGLGAGLVRAPGGEATPTSSSPGSGSSGATSTRTPGCSTTVLSYCPVGVSAGGAASPRSPDDRTSSFHPESGGLAIGSGVKRGAMSGCTTGAALRVRSARRVRKSAI